MDGSLLPDAESPEFAMTTAIGHARQIQIFIAIAIGSMLAAALVTTSLFRIFGTPINSNRLHFPIAFLISSMFLLAGSFSLRRATFYVSLERQMLFRRWLRIALACGILFIGVQAYGLRAIFPGSHNSTQVSRGVTPFVLVFAGLHAMHFFVALLFVSFVLARTIADRYDHEYHWGVTFCAWFWHALGMVWLAILAIFAIVL
jgi:cytochrome c oxidase subunit 3